MKNGKANALSKEIENISQIIDDLIAQINVLAHDTVYEVVYSLSLFHRKKEHSLAGIQEAITSANRQVEDIISAVQQMSKAFNQLTCAINSAISMIEQYKAAMEKTAAAPEDLTITEVPLANEEKTAVEEVHPIVRKLRVQGRNISAIARSLSETVASLQHLVSEFKLPQKPVKHVTTQPTNPSTGSGQVTRIARIEKNLYQKATETELSQK